MTLARVEEHGRRSLYSDDSVTFVWYIELLPYLYLYLTSVCFCSEKAGRSASNKQDKTFGYRTGTGRFYNEDFEFQGSKRNNLLCCRFRDGVRK